MDQGRRYRSNQVYVKDWDTFKKVWGDSSFIKQLADKSIEECKDLVKKKYYELKQSQVHQCYLFPHSLKPQYLKVMIDLVQTQQFKSNLDYSHEGLFLNKPKQLIIYKNRSSVSVYLTKYRHPDEYKKLFPELLNATKQLQSLIIQRNMKISKQLPKQEIEVNSKQIQQYQQKKIKPKLNDWKDLVNRMLVDFKSQNKQQEMLFLGVNRFIYQQLKQISQIHELYISNRYQNISKFDQYRDVVITKFDQNQSQETFDDKSLQSQQQQNIQQQQNNQPKQIVVKIPRDLENVVFKNYVQHGVRCVINLFSFGKAHPVEYIKIRLLSPNQTEQQKQYEQKILVIQGQYQYEAILHCFKSGFSTFQISAMNSVGPNKNPNIFKIWIEAVKDSANQKGIMKVALDNYSLYIMGQNKQGLIPNWSTQNTNTIITTQQKWQLSKFPCSDFSLSSHSIICNRDGSVAGWGKMYFFDQNVFQQDEENQDEDDDYGLTKLNSMFYRTQPPSLILESSKIRKVSCGEGYCLMIDYMGRAWSFGLNSFGQLGLQHTNQGENTSQPTIIKYFYHEKIFVRDVIASYFGASFAIDDKDQGYRWGTNQVEQSSRPVKDSYQNTINFQYPQIIAAQSVPILISKKVLPQKIKSIHPGQHFAFALTDTNRLYGWGKTKFLGKGKMEDAHFVPIDNICNPIHIQNDIKQVSVGLNHCLALKLDNTLIGWGQSKYYKQVPNIKQLILTPQQIATNFNGQFICGPDYTVFHEGPQTIRVVGKQQIFKQGKYQLPSSKIVKLQAGQGVIMITCVNQNINFIEEKKQIEKQKGEWEMEQKKQQ